MSTKTINSKILEKFENKIVKLGSNKEWARELETVNDMLTDYLLADEGYNGNTETSGTIFYLRNLRDFFKDLDDLAH